MARLFGREKRSPLPPPTYSNAAVLERIVKDEGVDADTARAWFAELLIFLDLAAGSRNPLSPPPDVDKAWHAFLLHSRDYEAYCRERFGKVIHHQPGEKPDPSAYSRAWQARQDYSSPNATDPLIWATPAVVAGAGSDAAPGDHGDHSHGHGSSVVENPGGVDPSPNLSDPGSGGGDSGGSSDSGGGGDSGGGSSCGSSCGSSS